MYLTFSPLLIVVEDLFINLSDIRYYNYYNELGDIGLLMCSLPAQTVCTIQHHWENIYDSSLGHLPTFANIHKIAPSTGNIHKQWL